MNKKLTLMLIAASLCASAWSCGSKVGSGDSSSPAETASASDTAAQSETAAGASSTDGIVPEETKAPATQSADGRYNTSDGLFSFAVSEDYKLVEDASAEYDMAFRNESSNVVIGITSVTGKHQSAKGFSDGIVPDYQQKFKEVNVEDLTVNDMPAEKLTALDENDGEQYIFSYTMVQYGNGDLFTVMYSVPATSSFSPEGDIADMLSSLEYAGEPLKTGDEVCDCGGFKLTVGDKFYIKDKGDNSVAIKYNLAGTLAEYMCQLAIQEKEGASVQELASELADKWNGIDYASEVSESKVDFYGRDAQCVSYKIEKGDYRFTVTTYFFEENGKVYSATLTADTSAAEQFANDCQSVLESLAF